MLLTIDAGNTRTKWAVFNNQGTVIQQGVCANNDLTSNTITMQNVSRAVVSNVAGEAHAKLIKSIFTSSNLTLHWFKSSAQCCQVINHYTMPETLGTDRWAALIAAWHLKQAACVVVNVGTAVTIDALVESSSKHGHGEFIGGMILPGLTLMQASLGEATAQLPDNTYTPGLSCDTFGTCTADAIASGAVNAICGAIERMMSVVTEKQQVVPAVILSGGDAAVIEAHLSKHVTKQFTIVDNLVLTGLYLSEYSHHQQSDMQ